MTLRSELGCEEEVQGEGGCRSLSGPWPRPDPAPHPPLFGLSPVVPSFLASAPPKLGQGLEGQRAGVEGLCSSWYNLTTPREAASSPRGPGSGVQLEGPWEAREVAALGAGAGLGLP